MTDIEIKAAVLAAYADKYPGWTKTSVAAITHNVAGGALVVVNATDDEKDDLEEICFFLDLTKVRIFETSVELAEYIENRNSYRQWIFTGQGISAIAFLLTLTAVTVFAFLPPGYNQNGKPFQALEQVLILAAGFFFGNQAGAKKG